MSDAPGFGVLLQRLLDNRGLYADHLARLPDLDRDELELLLRGSLEPHPVLLRALAMALALRPADLLAAAGWPVPPELRPAAPQAQARVTELVLLARGGEPAELLRLRRFARSLWPARPEPPTSTDDTVPGAGFGALLSCLMANRNLSAPGLAAITGLPEATLARLLSGDRPPAPDQLTALAEALDLRVDDLFALSGTALPESGVIYAYPVRPHLGGLVGDLVPLSAARLDWVLAAAHTPR
ncbi:helix-turn-helix transcriptional regulator [Catellatospora sp. KI3]|uniref:helix-turn-helix domain-containing protein n=1 Tax=Catellatospora sp. KI3 TaxID=3041620 RepID=UPI0024824490|nr:helix-turn-helix transcriptional regulator [Catellatospora sp. KI3]MDI1466302.1 helix-turn-helix transcriptional regulator [Catellatospora sp. KI3]